MMQTTPLSFEFVFVHGTWARDGTYGQKDSYFVQKLMDFADGNAGYQRFKWSGRNTVTAREQATNEFKEFVAQLPPKQPGTKRLAFCHSHGGSVVLSAFLDKKTASSFDGLVSIGTPFLHVYRLTEVEPSILPPFPPIEAALRWLALILFGWLGFGEPNLVARTLSALASIMSSAVDWVTTHPALAFINVGAVLLLMLLMFLPLLGFLFSIEVFHHWIAEERPHVFAVLHPVERFITWSASFLFWWLAFGELNLFTRTLTAIPSIIAISIGWMSDHPFLALAGIAAVVSVMFTLYALLLFGGMTYAQWRDDRRERIVDTPKEAAWKIKERCRLPVSAPVPTLLLRVPADETYGALIFSRVVSFLVLRVYGFIVLSMSTAIQRSRRWRSVGGLVSWPCIWIRQALRWILSLPVSLIAGGTLILFGREFLSVGGHILISAESTPPGSWQLTVLAPLDRHERRLDFQKEYNEADDDDDFDSFEKLETAVYEEWMDATQGHIHSRGYTDPRAVALITKWMSELS